MNSSHRGGARARAERGRKPAHGNAARVPFALLVTGLVLGGLALLLVLNTLSAANEVQRHSLADQDSRIAAEVEQLRNEIAASAAPANLASAAAALGMVPAGNPAFIVLGRNGSARLLGHPAAASAPYVPPPVTPTPHSHSPKPTPTNTTTPAGRDTSTTAGGAAATSTTTPAGHGATTTKHAKQPTPAPTTSQQARPSPTPTPTVTIPGGPR